MDSTTTGSALEERMSTPAALQRLAQERDPLAWAAILEAHGAEILSVARRVSGDPVLCEDICQETLLQIRASAGRFRPSAPADSEASARGWIMRIACCTALKMLRGRERLGRREAAVVTAAATTSPGVDEMALSREEAQRVRCEVANLPESLREPLSLRFFGALEYPALGVALGCSQDAAKKRVQRGLEVLRSRMAACGVAFSVGALICALSSSGAQAATPGAGATAGQVLAQNALDPQRLAAWQGLLNSSHAPALANVALVGELAVTTKIGLGVAAGVLFALAGVEGFRVSALQSEVAQARAAADKAAQSVTALEHRIEDRDTEIAKLRDKVETRGTQIDSMRSQVTALQQRDEAKPFFKEFAPGTLNLPDVALRGLQIKSAEDLKKLTTEIHTQQGTIAPGGKFPDGMTVMKLGDGQIVIGVDTAEMIKPPAKPKTPPAPPAPEAPPGNF